MDDLQVNNGIPGCGHPCQEQCVPCHQQVANFELEVTNDEQSLQSVRATFGDGWAVVFPCTTLELVANAIQGQGITLGDKLRSYYDTFVDCHANRCHPVGEQPDFACWYQEQIDAIAQLLAASWYINGSCALSLPDLAAWASKYHPACTNAPCIMSENTDHARYGGVAQYSSGKKDGSKHASVAFQDITSDLAQGHSDIGKVEQVVDCDGDQLCLEVVDNSIFVEVVLNREWISLVRELLPLLAIVDPCHLWYYERIACFDLNLLVDCGHCAPADVEEFYHTVTVKLALIQAAIQILHERQLRNEASSPAGLQEQINQLNTMLIVQQSLLDRLRLQQEQAQRNIEASLEQQAHLEQPNWVDTHEFGVLESQLQQVRQEVYNSTVSISEIKQEVEALSHQQQPAVDFSPIYQRIALVEQRITQVEQLLPAKSYLELETRLKLVEKLVNRLVGFDSLKIA